MSERRTDERAEAARGATDASARFDFVRVFRVAACLLFAAAPVLLYLRRPEAAFLVAALGAAAWFLAMRTALIRKHDLVKVGGRNWRPRREVEEESEREFEEDSEE